MTVAVVSLAALTVRTSFSVAPVTVPLLSILMSVPAVAVYVTPPNLTLSPCAPSATVPLFVTVVVSVVVEAVVYSVPSTVTVPVAGSLTVVVAAAAEAKVSLSPSFSVTVSVARRPEIVAPVV